MSASVGLQDVILVALRGNPGVTALVGSRIWDQAPADPAYPHITLGPSDFYTDDAECIFGRVETVQIDIWSRDQGKKWPCKKIVDAVKAALHGHAADMGADALVGLDVTLCRVMDDVDEITVHGIVQVEATIEEDA